MAKATKKRKIKESGGSVPEKKPMLDIESPPPPPPKEPTVFLSLNDDCYREIVQYLPLQDLCSASQVCQRLQDVAAEHFEREYKAKWIHLKNVRNEVRIFPKENYTKCFPNSISNVIVETADQNNNIDLELFCSLRTNYKQVQFKSLTIVEPFADDRIDEILGKVETIGFWECKISNKLHDIVLQHCKSMKNLVMYQNKNARGRRGKDNWMQQTYPSLEQLQCFFCDKSMNEKLPEFLQRNPSVKSLTWHFYKSYDEFNMQQMLQAIIKNGAALEELFLSFIQYHDLAMICNELKQLCDRKTFKRLEMNFFGENGQVMLYRNVDKLKLLTKLSGVHLRVFPNFTRLFPTIASLDTLKTLHIQSIWNYRSPLSIDWPHDRLSNLQELYVNHLSTFHVFDVNEYIVPFVRHYPQLKKIVFQRMEFKDDGSVIPLLCDYRKKLVNPEKLTIHLEKNEFNKLNHLIELLHADDGLVTIKRIVILPDVMNVNNPLFLYSHEEV